MRARTRIAEATLILVALIVPIEVRDRTIILITQGA